MKTTRKIPALLFAVLFVLSAITALFCFNLEWQAFNPDNYKQAFAKQHLYDRMPSMLTNAITDSIANDSGAVPYLKVLSRDNWQSIIEAALPPDEVAALTDSAIDSTFDYLNGKTDSINVSLVSLKQHLKDQGEAQVIKLILRAQPDCTAEQLLQMGFGLINGNAALCNVPDEMLGAITPLLEAQFQLTLEAFPNEFSIVPTAVADSRVSLDRIRMVFKITPVIALFFLFCLSITAIRNVRNWLTWWGWSFFAAGSASLLLAWIGAPLVGVIAERLLQNHGAALIPPVLFPVFGEAISAVASQILKPVIWQGLLIGILGFGMVGSERALRRATTMQNRP